MVEYTMNKFELLAPAGSFEILKAVVDAGADAVYVGGPKFGARAYANNFTTDELLQAIDYVHLRGVKIYLTVNTLLKDRELDSLYEYLLPLYKKGLDAVLVQDFGALMYIHQYFPDLPIHTSTQMTVTGVEGVRFLQQFGVTRVVMAREVSLCEMKEISEKTGMELEAFVHGALCYCYSGQCLFSSMLGGRSGNRGRCAQPCRLAYSVLDETQKTLRKDAYVISLKDFYGITHLKELLDAGVYSLKIEGRMKQQSYAAGVVSTYRKYVDLCERDAYHKVTPEDLEQLFAYGSRCGVTDKYLTQHNGKDMITFEKPSFSQSLEYVGGTKKYRPIQGYGSFYLGQPMMFALFCKEASVSVTGPEVLPAKNAPARKQDLLQRLSKMGDTAFVPEELQLEMEDGIFVPNGMLNQLRRDAVEALEKELLKGYRRNREIPREQMCEESGATQYNTEKIVNIVSLENRAFLSEILARDWVDVVYLDVNAYSHVQLKEVLSEDIRQCKKHGKEVFLCLPQIFRKSTREFYHSIREILSALELRGFVVRNYEEIHWVQEFFPDKEIVTDYNLYTYNSVANRSFLRLGISATTMPLELNRQEIRDRDNEKTQMILYGYYPLMVSAQCVHKSVGSCDKTPQLTYLKDRYQALFPVRNVCGECYNIIYNSLPTMLLGKREELLSFGIRQFRLHFSVETKEEVHQVLEMYEQYLLGHVSLESREGSDRYTNGHYKRGVE